MLNNSTSNLKPVLSKEAAELLVRVAKKPFSLYWGKNGWCPSNLPKGIKRAHFDELTQSGKVRVEMASLVPANPTA